MSLIFFENWGGRCGSVHVPCFIYHNEWQDGFSKFCPSPQGSSSSSRSMCWHDSTHAIAGNHGIAHWPSHFVGWARVLPWPINVCVTRQRVRLTGGGRESVLATQLLKYETVIQSGDWRQADRLIELQETDERCGRSKKVGETKTAGDELAARCLPVFRRYQTAKIVLLVFFF